MQVDLVIRGGEVVTDEHTVEAWIAVDGGKIVALGSGESWPQARRTIDASGKHVIPGVIDTEHHPTFPLEDWLFSETRAAVAAGVTTAAMITGSNLLARPPKPSPKREEIPPLMEVLPFVWELGPKYAWVDYFITPRLMNESQVKEIPDLAEKHGVTSYKIYLHTKSGEYIWSMWAAAKRLGFYYHDDGMIYLAMRNIATLGPPAVLCFHCENWEIGRVLKEELIAQGRQDVGAWDDKSPAFCEAGHVRGYSYYAKVTDCPIFIQHVTTPETVKELVKARAEGVKIYGNTSPHYLTLDKDTWRTNVPFRSKDTFPQMWEALRRGVIDSITSDHVYGGRLVEEIEKSGMKYGPIFEVAGTVPGESFAGRVDALLPLMMSEGVNKGRISLERMVQVCCENPARIFGLYPKKGTIAIGSDADLVIVDLNKNRTLTRDMLFGQAGWSIWEGWEIKGWPVMTILKG